VDRERQGPAAQRGAEDRFKQRLLLLEAEAAEVDALRMFILPLENRLTQRGHALRDNLFDGGHGEETVAQGARVRLLARVEKRHAPRACGREAGDGALRAADGRREGGARRRKVGAFLLLEYAVEGGGRLFDRPEIGKGRKDAHRPLSRIL